jgi:hypothetical protein
LEWEGWEGKRITVNKIMTFDPIHCKIISYATHVVSTAKKKKKKLFFRLRLISGCVQETTWVSAATGEMLLAQRERSLSAKETIVPFINRMSRNICHMH